MPTRSPARRGRPPLSLTRAPLYLRTCVLLTHASTRQIAPPRCGWDGTVREWDVAAERCTVSLSTSRAATSIDVSLAAAAIATGHCDHGLRVWDVRLSASEPVAALKHRSWVSGVAWSPSHTHQVRPPSCGNPPPRAAVLSRVLPRSSPRLATTASSGCGTSGPRPCRCMSCPPTPTRRDLGAISARSCRDPPASSRRHRPARDTWQALCVAWDAWQGSEVVISGGADGQLRRANLEQGATA